MNKDTYIFPEPKAGVLRNLLGWLRDLVAITLVVVILPLYLVAGILGSTILAAIWGTKSFIRTFSTELASKGQKQ